MKKIYILILLIVFSCSNDNENDETSNCINNQTPLSTNINITRILVYGSNQTSLLREYVIENNRITESRGGVVSLYNNCWFDYNYNSCGQLISIKCQNDGLLRTKLSYDTSGRLKTYRVGYNGGFTLKFEYTQNNTVIINEFRGYNEVNDSHASLNSSREWLFDNNENMITSIIENAEFEYSYSNQNFITSTDNENILNYHPEKNPFFLIFTNTYGRKNNFLINYGFDSITYSNPFTLIEELGLSNNLISSWENSSSGNLIRYTEILETSNGYVTEYREISDGEVSKLIVVEYQ
ncbi:hypothetical protein AB9K26_07170 [Psychroserpens sp. XS_ASV72]|uniref:hypothetical protein n=1 Tax=Psychroserpens sp. XS_ASV72 TaxID=3241293 RepID=UPI003516500F